MISFFRRYLTSWPVLVLFGIILVAFAVTGVGDPLGGSAPAGSIASVGKRTVTEADLLEVLDRQVRQLRERDPAVNQAMAAREGLVELIATQVIGQVAMEELASTSGLNASDEAADLVIAGIPAFQSAGKFDQAKYERLLAEQRLTDRKLRQSVRGDLLREQLIKPITGALAVPDGVAELYARLLIDRHEGGVSLVPAVPAGQASKAEAETWYKTNAARFTIPERRGFRYAFIDRAAITAAVAVSDKQIADAFAKDPAKYGAAPTRVLEQVVVPDEAKAKALAAAAAKQGFAAAAQAIAGFGAADIAVGTQTEAAFAKATSADVAKAAFALAAGGISAPVKSSLGWHVVRVASLGSAGKTLAQARAAVEADVKAQLGQDAVADAVNSIEDGVEAGKSFGDIAKDLKLAITVQTPVSDKGLGAGQPALTGDVAIIAGRAFRHESADGPVVEDLGGGKLVVMETTSVLPAAPPPLAEVLPLATAAATQDKAMKAAKAKADAVVAAIKKGSVFPKALADAGLPSPRPLVARRIELANAQNVPEAARAFLNGAAGSTQVVAVPGGWAIVHVDRIVPGDPRSQPGLVEQARREVGSALPAEMAEGLARASMAAVKTNRNDAAIRALRLRLTGDGAQ